MCLTPKASVCSQPSACASQVCPPDRSDLYWTEILLVGGERERERQTDRQTKTEEGEESVRHEAVKALV